MVIDWLPASVQLVPLVEVYAVKVLPLRTSFTQYGATALNVDELELAPVEARRMNPYLPALVTNIDATFDPPVNDSRIITPAFARLSLAVNDATRATMVPLPVKDRYTNRNSSV